MTSGGAPAAAGRILAEAIRDLPDGLEARPITDGDLPALTALERDTDIAGCGHSSTNADEVRDELEDPDCGWGRGCATVWDGPDLVGALVVFDGLAAGRGWMLDVYSRPGDPRAPAINATLIDAGLREGNARWAALPPAPDEPVPVAKSGCHANDAPLRAALVQQGFSEVRTFLTMRIDHGGPPSVSGPGIPSGYTIRAFADVQAEWRTLYEVSRAAFLDHFDYTAVDYDEWRLHLQGATSDPSQWHVIEHADQIVAYARGSNRYASEQSGYVASIGVVREHRGRGLARALLETRFADDARRGFHSTLLHVDAASPTGADRLYTSVGMVTDSTLVWFHRPLVTDVATAD